MIHLRFLNIFQNIIKMVMVAPPSVHASIYLLFSWILHKVQIKPQTSSFSFRSNFTIYDFYFIVVVSKCKVVDMLWRDDWINKISRTSKNKRRNYRLQWNKNRPRMGVYGKCSCPIKIQYPNKCATWAFVSTHWRTIDEPMVFQQRISPKEPPIR